MNNQKPKKLENQVKPIPRRRIHRDWGERMCGRRARRARADPWLILPGPNWLGVERAGSRAV